MTEKKVLTDGNHVIELHHLQNSGHNEGLIVAYLPEGEDPRGGRRVQPAGAGQRAAPNAVIHTTPIWLKTSNRLKLDVETIIPIHYPADSRKVSITELRRIVGQSN